jgi:hypothetical protein
VRVRHGVTYSKGTVYGKSVINESRVGSGMECLLKVGLMFMTRSYQGAYLSSLRV